MECLSFYHVIGRVLSFVSSKFVVENVLPKRVVVERPEAAGSKMEDFQDIFTCAPDLSLNRYTNSESSHL